MQSKLLALIVLTSMVAVAYCDDTETPKPSSGAAQASLQAVATDGNDSSSAISAEAIAKFSKFASDNKKKYRSMADMNYRMGLYQKNSNIIDRHNRSKAKWKMGVNQFTDMTDDEIKSYLANLNVKEVSLDEPAPKKRARSASLLGGDRRLDETAPVTVPVVVAPVIKLLDDTYKGLSVLRKNTPVIPAVKNQKSCGSCYAHATIAMIESALMLKRATKDSNNNPVYTPLDLSEQQIVDCTNVSDPDNGNYYNKGCDGGSVWNSAVYIYRSGITTETSYPYKYVDQSCDRTTAAATDSDTKKIMPYRVTKNSMKNFLDVLKVSPIAISMRFSANLMKYKSGVYDATTDPENSPDFPINHAVLATGFDTTTDTPYIEIRNSWGTTWGEQGYLRIGISLTEGDNGPLNLLSHSGNVYIKP